MATYIKTLKEDNGDITYPQTKAGAVLLDNGSDLETALAAKADASTVNQKITVGDVQSTDIVANAVTTAKITDGAVTTSKLAKGAVTSDKIDWTTLSPRWKVLVASDNNHITVPGGYSFLRIRAYAVIPVTDGGRAAMNSNNRAPGSNCYVNYFGRTSGGQAVQGSFKQEWDSAGSSIAVAYLEATNENTLLRYVVDVQAYRTGSTLISEVSCCAMGNDQNYILKGEANLDSADGDFDLHFQKGNLSPTEVHWVVEGLEK